jgi:hypothetical protein
MFFCHLMLDEATNMRFCNVMKLYRITMLN